MSPHGFTRLPSFSSSNETCSGSNAPSLRGTPFLHEVSLSNTDALEVNWSLTTETGTDVVSKHINQLLTQEPIPNLDPQPRTVSSSSLSRKASAHEASAKYTTTIIGATTKSEGKHENPTAKRYRRGKLLGMGGFATVYLCTDMATRDEYAVKIISKAKPRARRQLEAEVDILSSLHHRHVCKYYHSFEDQSNWYLLLELCQNESMKEMIRRRKRLTEPEAAYFMKQLIEAMTYLHGNYIVHRDLKLGNLFLDEHMDIKVGDFGLAKRLKHPQEKLRTLCGTPNYIAPELIRGTRQYSFEADIWSMGVILYTFLIGKPPFECRSVKATYRRIVANEYSIPDLVPLTIHAKDMIASILVPAPQKRPSLETMRNHPFFTAPDAKAPLSLPSSVLFSAPSWHVNEHGQLVTHQGNEASIPNQPHVKDDTERDNMAVAVPPIALYELSAQVATPSRPSSRSPQKKKTKRGASCAPVISIDCRDDDDVLPVGNADDALARDEVSSTTSSVWDGVY